MLLVIAGCRTQVYVPVPAASHDSSYVARAVSDTVFIHDSVAVSEHGDTVVKERMRIVYRTRQLNDTVFSCRVDTVTVAVPAQEEPDGGKAKPRWMMWGCLAGMALAGIFFGRRR